MDLTLQLQRAEAEQLREEKKRIILADCQDCGHEGVEDRIGEVKEVIDLSDRFMARTMASLDGLTKKASELATLVSHLQTQNSELSY